MKSHKCICFVPFYICRGLDIQASASVADFPLVPLHTVCVVVSWFVISSRVKLLHLVSGQTLTDTILMSASFYSPAWLQFDPQRLYSHTLIKSPFSAVWSPSNLSLWGMNGCIQTHLLKDLRWASLLQTAHQKGRERKQKVALKVKKCSSKKTRARLLQRNRRKGERLTARDKEREKAWPVGRSRRHKRGKREGHS